MRNARFQRLTEAFGARIERWPTAERMAGAELARMSSKVAAMLETARVIDDALDLATPRIDDDAVERLLARVSARVDEASRVPPAPMSIWARVRPHAPTAGFLTAMLLAGMIVGNVGWASSGSAVAASLDGILTSGYRQSTYLAALSE